MGALPTVGAGKDGVGEQIEGSRAVLGVHEDAGPLSAGFQRPRLARDAQDRRRLSDVVAGQSIRGPFVRRTHPTTVPSSCSHRWRSRRFAGRKDATLLQWVPLADLVKPSSAESDRRMAGAARLRTSRRDRRRAGAPPRCRARISGLQAAQVQAQMLVQG